jgi:16S rRNA (cytosine1407-C5)-methyltransferase
MERLGAEATYTLADATRLSRTFEPETFDKVLLDAPCSGEGLMTLNDMKLFDSWSVTHIRRLSELQKKILHESWQTLKPGGTLVYSTCTMAPEEDEAVIDYFLRKHEDARLEPVDAPLDNRIPALQSWNDKAFANDLSPCLRLVPGKLTEAFFVAKLKKF